jgi:hypothetical protein
LNRGGRAACWRAIARTAGLSQSSPASSGIASRRVAFSAFVSALYDRHDDTFVTYKAYKAYKAYILDVNLADHGTTT